MQGVCGNWLCASSDGLEQGQLWHRVRASDGIGREKVVLFALKDRLRRGASWLDLCHWHEVDLGLWAYPSFDLDALGPLLCNGGAQSAILARLKPGSHDLRTALSGLTQRLEKSDP